MIIFSTIAHVTHDIIRTTAAHQLISKLSFFITRHFLLSHTRKQLPSPVTERNSFMFECIQLSLLSADLLINSNDVLQCSSAVKKKFGAQTRKLTLSTRDLREALVAMFSGDLRDSGKDTAGERLILTEFCWLEQIDFALLVRQLVGSFSWASGSAEE